MSNKTNIYNHLFAYIKSNSDLTIGMAQMYENSLIFIGDEKQIWQPKTNAYVGIGMTAYNSIFDAVSSSANTIRQYSTNTNGSYFITFSNNNGNGVFANSYVNTGLRFNPFTKTAYSSYYEGQLDPKDQWGYIGVIIHVTGVSIHGVVPTLLVGDSLALSAIITPDYASDTSVTWSSSDTSVLTVSNDGVVSAVGDGTATITVTTNDGSFTDTCSLTVDVPIVHVVGVSISGAMSPLLAGDTLQLSATVFPSDATDKSVTWSSSDTSVATVSSSGLVTAISGGNVTITATTTDGSYTSTCYISINGIVNVTGVSISGSESTLPIGGTTTLIATISPDDATDKSVTWSSSDISVATVSGGAVTALSTGTATITVTTTDGSHSDTYSISVTDYVDLGLSVMWRNRNIGATSQESSGLFFAWGETTGYETPAARNTALGMSDGFTTNSYNTRSAASISGDLKPADDAARAYLGGAWRMPTREEFTELYNGTDHANTTINGVAGVKFMKKADHNIYVFFPFCGYNGDKLYNYNGAGYYWSTKAYSSARAIEMHVSPSSITTTGDDGKQWGLSIRPVIDYVASEYNYAMDYLTFKALTSGTILWKALGTGYTKTIQYSLNGAAWVSITSDATTPPSIAVSVGDKIRFKGSNSAYAGSKNDYSGFAGGTASYDAEGNIMSLVYGDGFLGNTGLSGTYNFCSMFKQTKVVSAQNLVLPSLALTDYCYRAMFSLSPTLTHAPALPATTLSTGVYWYMFEGCAIESAPDLLATTLVKECYGHMFTKCTSLSYIKCLATGGFGSTDCKAGWVNQVASSGTFVKDSSVAMSTWSSGNNGIPSNWTVVDVG